MTRATPRQLRYSLVPRGDGAGIAPREDMLALYQQADWEFMCLTGNFWLFSSEDPAYLLRQWWALRQLRTTEASAVIRREIPSLLCPVQLTVEQYGDGTSFYMDYLHLTLPQLAEPMARDLLGANCPQSHFLWQESSLPGVDLVLLAYERESGICRGAALCCDGRVAVYDIWSNDDPNLTQALPFLARIVLEGHPVG